MKLLSMRADTEAFNAVISSQSKFAPSWRSFCLIICNGITGVDWRRFHLHRLRRNFSTFRVSYVILVHHVAHWSVFFEVCWTVQFFSFPWNSLQITKGKKPGSGRSPLCILNVVNYTPFVQYIIWYITLIHYRLELHLHLALQLCIRSTPSHGVLKCLTWTENINTQCLLHILLERIFFFSCGNLGSRKILIRTYSNFFQQQFTTHAGIFLFIIYSTSKAHIIIYSTS